MATGVFAQDVTNDLYRECELRVLQYCRRRLGPDRVEDVSDQHLSYDLLIRSGGKTSSLDVKCDDRAIETGRIVYETGLRFGTRRSEGWGERGGMDIVCYVFPARAEDGGAPTTGPWRGLFVKTAELQRYFRSTARGADGTIRFHERNNADGSSVWFRTAPLALVQRDVPSARYIMLPPVE